MQDTSVNEATELLANAIRHTEEYQQYQALKDAVLANETNRALLKEYQRLQTKLQMAAVSGLESSSEDVQRFQQMTSLLYMNAETAQYLMAQMRVQQLTGEVFQRVTNAAGLELELPGM